jgi:di/tricarboxylate transporter
MHIAIVLGLLVVALFLFSWGRYPVDQISISILVVLIVTGTLTPTEALSGFGSEFVWTLASLFVLTGTLQQTGILDLFGSRILKQARTRPGYLLTLIMSTVGVTSSLMNNTTVTALYLAPVVSVARRLEISASKLLMPVAYASILGGTCTLIGTSTNIAVSGYLAQNGFAPIRMFEMLPVGVVLFFVGLIYMLTIGKRLLPAHPNESYVEEFGLKEYVSEIVVLPGSPLIQQELQSSSLSNMGFRVLNIIRGSENFIPEPETRILAGDVLLVEGSVNTLMDVKAANGIEIRADGFIDKDLQADNIRLAEVLVTPQSDFVNSTLRDVRFRHDYGVAVIAINRKGHPIREKIGHTPLRIGDVLLVQGEYDRIIRCKQSGELNILEDFKPLLYRKKRGLQAILLFILAIVVSVTGPLPTSACFISAALLMVVFGSITLEKAYESIDFRLLIMIASMSSMGIALTKSGAADFIATAVLHYLGTSSLPLIMTAFIILTVFLTQPLSNAAAALVVLPVALQTAQQLQVDPHPFAMAIMLSASVSLITPFEPSCMLIYTPGKYTFSDFFRVGFILTLLLMAIIVVMVPLLWHF